MNICDIKIAKKTKVFRRPTKFRDYKWGSVEVQWLVWRKRTSNALVIKGWFDQMTEVGIARMCQIGLDC